MFALLVIAALVVALGGTAAGLVAFGNERKRRGLAGGDTKALPSGVGDVLHERTLRELRTGDVLTIDGKDFLCEGVINYDEDGHRWIGARIVDGKDVAWCVVGIERVGTAVVRVLHGDDTDVAGYPPEVLVIGEVRYTLDKRGNATCKLHGDLGNLIATKGRPEGTVERCRWWLYQSPGDDTAIVEQWGADYRVLRGKKMSGDTIDLIPGS